MTNQFVHLHTHTEYSILDGACRIDKLIDQAQQFNMPAITITDHGNMFGVLDFYQQATKAGIKPIIGCELYVAPQTMQDKQLPDESTNYYHLILLAKDGQGYENLMQLVTGAYFDGFYYKPRIDKELLAKHHEGLIALSSCLHGEVAYKITHKRLDVAREKAGVYSEIMGKGNFYLELMDHNMPEQKTVNTELIKISKELDLPLVATNDCHYLKAEDSESHDALLCIQTGKKVNDVDRMKFSSNQLYFKSPAEMEYLFRDVPEALTNTLEIAEKCNVEIVFNKPMLPRYQPPGEFTLDSYFEDRSYAGLEKRFTEIGIEADDPIRQDYYDRLKHEMEIIKNMEFPGYFLIVWDFINHARERNIPVGPGRGSAAGSLVAYSLRITDIDPIKFNLVFERFLNPSRISMPDIDIDFCKRGRDEVIQYVEDKYGSENVSQIITFGTMAARNVIRDVGRVLDVPYGDVDRIAKLVPADPKMTIEKALDMEPLLNQEIEADEQIAHLMKISRALEGLKRHPSTHAAGVVISRDPLLLFTPLYKSSRDEVTTQYEMSFLENLGLLKMDFLGLKTLTVINDTMEIVKQTKKQDIDIEKIPIDDEAAYKLLSDGKTAGVFQLESSGMTEIVRKLQPTSIYDLTALVALYRPGPLGSGMVDDFLKRKHGLVAVSYLLPQLEPILNETYGVILYQEQVMRIASDLGGYSMAKADELRKAMGKKKEALMEKHKSMFLEGARERGIPVDKAEILFEQMSQFAGYGFNKSHAAAYALVSYQTAYLKAHFPHEYMAALMSSEQDNTDKIVRYISECRADGIAILPPDANVSLKSFTVSGAAIRFGLGAVKNVGVNAIDSIIQERRKDGKFESFFDFCQRVDLRCVNKRVVEALIKAGAFESLGVKRSQLHEILDQALESAQQIQKDKQIGQFSLFGEELEEEYCQTVQCLPDIPEWPQHLLLSYEKETLGFYITGHPLQYYQCETDAFATQTSLSVKNLQDNDKFVISGIIISHKVHLTKKKERMAFVTLEDLVGTLDITILPDVYQEFADALQTDMPILIKGQVNMMNGNQKIKALEIMTLSHMREKYTDSVTLILEATTVHQSLLDKLKNLFESHPGSCRVTLRFRKAADTLEIVDMEVSDGLRIAITEPLIKDLEGLLGDRSIVYELTQCIE